VNVVFCPSSFDEAAITLTADAPFTIFGVTTVAHPKRGKSKSRKEAWRLARAARPPRHRRYKSFSGFLREEARDHAAEAARRHFGEEASSHVTAFHFADGVLSVEADVRAPGKIAGPIEITWEFEGEAPC
jgi:hypothetical protein